MPMIGSHTNLIRPTRLILQCRSAGAKALEISCITEPALQASQLGSPPPRQPTRAQCGTGLVPGLVLIQKVASQQLLAQIK